MEDQVHGLLHHTEAGHFMFEFPFGTQTIQHVFNVAELDALKAQIDEIRTQPVGASIELRFIRGVAN